MNRCSPDAIQWITAIHRESTANVSVLANFLARRELLTAGLKKFNDKPENYWAWKSAFSNATEDLGVKASEELDLLI